MSKTPDERIKELEEEVRILSKAVSVLIQNSNYLYSITENHAKAIKTFMESYNNTIPEIEKTLVLLGKFAQVSSSIHTLALKSDSRGKRNGKVQNEVRKTEDHHLQGL